MQRLLIRYGIECFLRRLEASRFAKAFVLKGAMSFAVHLDQSRTTKDADFQVYGLSDAKSLVNAFSQICSIEQDDGLKFEIGRIRAESVGGDREYPGFKVTVTSHLGGAQIPLQFDIGFGEVITPAPRTLAYPTMLKMKSPSVRAYPTESVIAEKFQAMVQLGMRNTRMKDFYDLHEFAVKSEFDGEILSAAIRNTFGHRGTPVPNEAPLALQQAFYGDKKRATAFKAFAKSLPTKKDLEACCQTIESFLIPVCRAIASNEPFLGHWQDGAWI